MNRSPSKFSSSGSSLTFSPGKTPGQVYERSRCYLLFVTWLCICSGCDHLSSSSSPWSCSCWRIIFNGIYNFGPSCSPWSSVSFILSWIILVNIDCFFGGFNLLRGNRNWTSNLHGFLVVMDFCGLFLYGFRNSLNLVRIQGLFLADNLSASCLLKSLWNFFLEPR